VSLFRGFLTVGVNTLGSRVLGFAREMMIAATLGAGPVADAFYAAFRFPNLFRRLFAEGAFNSAFIPLFARALEGEGEVGARRFAEEVLAALAVILLAFTIVVIAAAPALTATIIAPGFVSDPDKFELTVTLSRIMFPYLACMSLVAMLSGVLNAQRRFFAAAFAPILLNVILVAVLGWAVVQGVDAATVGLMLGWGVLAAGLAQLILLAVAVRRAGWAMRPRRPRLTEGVRRLLWLAAPAAIAGGITQLNLFIGQIIASTKAGAIAALQYADRIYQLPLGVVGIAIGVVLLPELSRTLRAGHERETAHTQNRALEFALFLTLPAAAALAIIPEEIVRVLFERGAFRPETTQTVADVLRYFAFGLPAFVLVKVFSPGFFAREDTKTPMYVAGVTMALNVAFSLALFPVMEEAGIALATTLSGWANALLLFTILLRRGQWPLDRGALQRSAVMAAVSGAMAAALAQGAGSLDGWMRPSAGVAAQASGLLVLVGGGALVYFTLVHLTGAADLRGLVRLVRRR